MYKGLIRPLLFLMNAEQAHHFTFKTLKVLFQIPGVKAITSLFFGSLKGREKQVMGLHFKNPVGLAAGFDKNAECYNEFSNFGFGFIEIGTVTPIPQPGNPKKRIFRLVEDKSLINRLGFNNKGLSSIVNNLKKQRDIIIGANIGKNFFTKNNEAYNDYLQCISELNEFIDYFAVNISSPNTKGLREFHDKSLLRPLLEKLIKFNDKQNNKRPLLLKISPDLSEEQLAEIVVLIKDLNLDGIIATNTTVSRDGATSKFKMQQGGMSGQLLKIKSNTLVKYLRKNLGENFPIIGVGGIMSADDAIERLNSGADLIQIYTGFIYRGPSLIKEINKAIINQSN